MKKTKFTIKGTHCKACKTLIEDVCKDIEGVKTCKVDFETGKIEIQHDDKLDLKILKNEIEGLGLYKVEGQFTEFLIPQK